MENHPKKLLIIGPDPFFLYWPGCLNGRKQKVHNTKSTLMKDWVFRLGFSLTAFYLFEMHAITEP